MIKNEMFFPIRYETSRPFLKNWLLKYKTKSPHDIETSNLKMEIQNDLFFEMEKAEKKLPPEILPDQRGFDRRLSQELNFFFFYNFWNQKGKNIFYFTRELLKMLEHTDVDDVPYSQLKFPFQSFYISTYELKNEIGIESHGNKIFLDGVLVTNNYWKERQIDLQFCTYIENAPYSKNWYNNVKASTHGFWFRLNFEKSKDTIKEAKLYAKDFDDKLYNIDELENLEEFSSGFFNQNIKLIINTICYLSSDEAKTTKEKFPDDLPAHLQNNYNKAKTKHKRNVIENDIKRNGFSKIKICSFNSKQSESNNNLSFKEVSTHWRRGFWRNQAYGPGMKNHRLMWIKPTIVRGDKGDPNYGHIYTN